MGSDAGLSTDDLARSGAARQEDVAVAQAPGLGQDAPSDRGGPGPTVPMGDVPLLDPADGERFRERWSDAQARFVDDPRDAVRSADGLVAELMQALARAFSDHKGGLEAQWQGGGTPDTEELRQALQMYRSFFNRLLST